MGTEFGVEVTGAGSTDVHVLTGRVELRPMRDVDAPIRRRVVTAGSALRVSSGGRQVAAIPYDFSRFGASVTESALPARGVDSPVVAATDKLVPSNFSEYGQDVAGYQDFFGGTRFDPGWVEIHSDKLVPTGSTSGFTLPGDGTLHIRRAAGVLNKLLYAGVGYPRTAQTILAMIRVNSPVLKDPDGHWRGGVGVSADPDENYSGISLVAAQDGVHDGRGLHTNLMNDYVVWGPVNVEDLATDAYYWLRLTYDGVTATAKVWPADGATAEPADYQTTWLAPGRRGLAGLVGNSYDGDSHLQVNYVLILAQGLPNIRAGVPPDVTRRQPIPEPVAERP